MKFFQVPASARSLIRAKGRIGSDGKKLLPLRDWPQAQRDRKRAERGVIWMMRQQVHREEVARRERKKNVLVDTEYDRAKVPPCNGNDPHPALVV